MDPDAWDDEQAWTTQRYSPAYVGYLRATVPPTQAGDAEVIEARETLHRTPLVDVILSRQLADGFWPLGGPPWFRIYPVPLLVLLEYGLHDHPAVGRGLDHLLSMVREGRFDWPRNEPHDPKEYYVAFQGRSLQVMIRAGLTSDSRVQEVASILLRRQRWDGGWSTKPAWMYRPGEPRSDPQPSCWICTLEVMRGVGKVLSFPPAALRRVFSFWETHLRPTDTGVVLACLDFCAHQGLGVHHPQVERLHGSLDAGREPDGRFPRLSDYYELMANHLSWRLTSSA